MGNISVPVWWKNGGMLVNRDALPAEHPESTYNYIKNVLKLNPADYGVFTEREEMIRNELASKTKEELLTMLVEARMTIRAMESAGF